ncbi:MAG: lipid II flippase MurJ [Janthinobacterium lividum]
MSLPPPGLTAASPAQARSPIAFALRLSAGALLGKIFGFARELIFARLLGVGLIADAYRGAVTATLLPIAALQGDLVPSILIPLHREWNRQGHGSRMFTPLTAIFALIASVLALLVWMFAGWWVDFVVPGFSPAARAITITMLQWMAVGMPASVVTACMSSIEISVGRARITTLRATVQNIATILGVLALAVTGRPEALGISFAAGFWLLLLGGGWLLWREGEIAFRDIKIRAAIHAWRIFFARTKPLLIQPAADQVNTLIERVASSLVGSGTLAALDYARSLTETAEYLVSQPIGFVVLAQAAPTGTDLHARVEALARPLLALALPASLTLAVFAPDMVRVIYERGAFRTYGVMLTADTLRGISCGLWATTLGYILLRMLNAASRNGVVARILVGSYAVNIVINLLVPRLVGILGIGLGEAARGVTILIGASIALGCGRLVLRLFFSLLPALIILATSFVILRLASLPPLSTLVVAALALACVSLNGIRPELRTLYQRIRPARAGS